jgi:hypothetical protein
MHLIASGIWSKNKVSALGPPPLRKRLAQIGYAERERHWLSVRRRKEQDDLVDIFAVQDEITEVVATAIEPVVAQTERHHAVRKPPESLGAWEAYQRGLRHMNRGSVRDVRSMSAIAGNADIQPTAPNDRD